MDALQVNGVNIDDEMTWVMLELERSYQASAGSLPRSTRCFEALPGTIA
jgi:flagellar hook-associated protein FlgK